MTSALALAPSTGLDPALPGLPAALSASPPGTPAGAVCRVRSVEWEPRRRCLVVHEVRNRDGVRGLLTCDVGPAGTLVRRPEDDGALPGLARALDPAVAAHRLAGVDGLPAGPLRTVPVAWRPGVRAVVAYEGAGRPDGSRCYAKVLADGLPRYAAVAEAIAGAARRRGAPTPVPDLIAVWPDLGAVVTRAAPGRALSDVLRDATLPEPARLRCAARLGRLLAEVHATPGLDGPRWSPDDELAGVEALLAAAGHADPALGRALAALLDRLADVPPPQDRAVLGHGSFRTGQVVVDGARLSLLDLDAAGVSDAGRDAGNASAYLVWAGIRGALRPQLAAGLQDAFAAGYAEAAPAPDARALAWWTAAAMAKIAGRRFRSLATGEWDAVPLLVDRAVALLDTAAVRPAAGQGGRPVGSAAAPPLTALDPAAMTAVLRAAPSLRGSGAVRVLDARAVAEAAGRRRVLRYDVQGLDPGRVVPVVAKIHAARHRSSMAWQNLRLLGAEVFAATPGLGVPRAVCHLPALRMVVYRRVSGTPLDRLAADAGAASAERAARWLAALHASPVVLARRLDLAHEVTQVEDWAARIAEAAPGAEHLAHGLAGELAAAAADLPVAPEVPVHKDFHAGHVLVGDGPADDPVHRGIVVIDLDEARMGDPALDVAHLISYLDLSPWAGAPAAREAFLAGYGPLPGPAAEARLAFFAAHTHLKIAKQLVAGRGPLPAPPARWRTEAVTAVLRKGLACLGG